MICQFKTSETTRRRPVEEIRPAPASTMRTRSQSYNLTSQSSSRNASQDPNHAGRRTRGPQSHQSELKQMENRFKSMQGNFRNCKEIIGTSRGITKNCFRRGKTSAKLMITSSAIRYSHMHTENALSLKMITSIRLTPSSTLCCKMHSTPVHCANKSRFLNVTFRHFVRTSRR